MKNLYDDKKALQLKDDLALRVYTSNLLGKNDELVLHGGGNTSVKIREDNEDILYVKGSGWDLVSIQKQGFSPVKLEALISMAKLDTLTDTKMLNQQKKAMTCQNAPTPSVEAILHAIIPFKFVDHTHSDAIVTITNSKNSKKYINELFCDYLIVPYIMPGFELAKRVYEMSKELNFSKCGGIILHNHGIFTFSNDAKEAYTKMIDAVSKGEKFLKLNAFIKLSKRQAIAYDTKELIKQISKEKSYGVFAKINQDEIALEYSSSENLQEFATRGVLTPEHIIRTKRIPLVLQVGDDISQKIKKYKQAYKKYFNKYKKNEICLNASPNYAVIKNFGLISFGIDEKEANIINDIITHSAKAVLRADKLGGYKSINEKNSFNMEYWELEQNKLKEIK